MTLQTLVRQLPRAVAMLVGVLAAVTVFGRATPEQRALHNQRDRFEELTPAAKGRIRPAWQDLQNQSAERKVEIRRIHDAVTSDPELAQTMTRFAGWWTSLNPFEADELRSLPKDQLAAEVSARYRDDLAAEQKLHVDFHAWWQFSRFRFGERERGGPGGDDDTDAVPELVLTTAQFSSLLAPVAELPAVTEVRAAAAGELSLTNPEHQLLQTCLNIMEAFLDRSADRKRTILESIHQQLLTRVPDEEWSREYRARTQDVRFGLAHRTLTPIVLIRTLVWKLGQRLKGSMALDDETMIREFASTADQAERKNLMQLRPSRALQRIEQRVFAAGQGGDSPERKLMQRYLETDSRLTDFFRSPESRSMMQLIGRPPGNGPPGGGPPRTPDGPRRDGQRPPRQ